jgi:hypothetical protein
VHHFIIRNAIVVFAAIHLLREAVSCADLAEFRDLNFFISPRVRNRRGTSLYVQIETPLPIKGKSAERSKPGQNTSPV